MFVKSSRRWHAGTSQCASGTFLLLCLPKTSEDPTAEKECPFTGCDARVTGPHGELVPCPECERETYMPSWHAPFTDLRAFVQHVKLRQCGHWMMGEMNIHGERISLSGTYGGDGLPTDVDRKTWEHGLPLPPELIESYRTAEGGHNCAGSEGQSMHDWAAENLKALRAASRKQRVTTT